MKFLGLSIDEQRQRHAPCPLARQRPIGTIGDHRVEPRLAPARIEAGVLDAAQRCRAQRLDRLHAAIPRHVVHAGEPLRRRAIDDRRLVPPAMHVAVRELLGVQKVARLADLLDDPGVRVPDLLAAEVRQVRGERAVALHRIQHVLVLHPVAPARDEVVDTVRGRAMDDAGALFQRHVLAEIDRRRPVVKGVPERDVLECHALCRRDDTSFEPEALERRQDEVLRQYQMPARGLDQRIDEFRVHVQRLVRRDRPGRRRPDHRVDRTFGRLRKPERARESFSLARIGQRKADVDCDVLAVLVLDLGLGERAAAVEAPVDRLQPAIQIALFEDPAQRADLVGFALVGHRCVRMVPVAQDAEPLELHLLPRDLRGRVGAGEPLRLGSRQVLAVSLLDLHLDRHPVAIPAGNVRCVEARHRAALDHEVLENLVERVADVDVGVRVRRAVVQHEPRASSRRLADRFVDLALLPILDPAGLALRQVSAHRKRRVGQVQRRFVIGFRVVGHREVKGCAPSSGGSRLSVGRGSTPESLARGAR